MPRCWAGRPSAQMGPVVGSLVPQNWPLNNAAENCSSLLALKVFASRRTWVDFGIIHIVIRYFCAFGGGHKFTSLVSHSSLGDYCGSMWWLTFFCISILTLFVNHQFRKLYAISSWPIGSQTARIVSLQQMGGLNSDMHQNGTFQTVKM